MITPRKVRFGHMLVFMIMFIAIADESRAAGESIGTGDSQIHIIPTLSASSVKNGGMLTIQAVAKAKAGVAKVEADIEGVEKIRLLPETMSAVGVSQNENMGVYRAVWKARGLTEKVYTVAVSVTDREGHIWTDRSLKFSDPAAGNSTPGSTAYPGDALKIVNDMTLSGERWISSVVMDGNGYAYLSVPGNSRYNYPGKILKVTLGTSETCPKCVGCLQLNAGEYSVCCGVIDTLNGYAYFGISESPQSSIVKIALGSGSNPPTRVGSVTLFSGDCYLSGGIIDPANGYGYWLTASGTRLLKIALGSGSTPPVRWGDASFGSGNGSVGVIDANNHCAYYGTSDNPAQIVKFSLATSAPTRIGSLTLDSGEYAITTADIDAAHGYAYFGASTLPGKIVKVALGGSLPTKVGTLTFNTGENRVLSGVIDAVNGYGYYTTEQSKIVKITLESGSNPPTRLAVSSTEQISGPGAAIDTAGGAAYFVSNSYPVKLLKVAVGDGSTTPAVVASRTFNPIVSSLDCGVVDSARGYAYFGTYTQPGQIVKIRISDCMCVGVLTLNSGENNLHCAVIDPGAGYAYFGADASSASIVRVALGSGDDPPTRVDSVPLGVSGIGCAGIDLNHGYAYFSASTPNRIFKIALGTASTPPACVGYASVNDGIRRSMVIDTNNQYAYLGTCADESDSVVKFALGNGANPPVRIGGIAAAAGYQLAPNGAVIDQTHGYAYFDTYVPYSMIKVALGAGDDLPRVIGSTTLPGIGLCMLDAVSGYAYTSGLTKIALGAGDSLPTCVGSLAVSGSYGVLDAATGYAYIARGGNPSSVCKVALSYMNNVHANRILMPEQGYVKDVRFYSHAGSGNLRLAIYNDGTPRELLWQSASTSNTVSEGWITNPISSGTPDSLMLQAGNYWLAWQTDSTADVPSYAVGDSSMGFYLGQPYGSFPSTISESLVTHTTNLWSEYLTYGSAPYLVWVNFDYFGLEDGTLTNPFNTVAEGALTVSDEGTVRIYAGSSISGIRINKPLRLESYGGTAIIGR